MGKKELLRILNNEDIKGHISSGRREISEALGRFKKFAQHLNTSDVTVKSCLTTDHRCLNKDHASPLGRVQAQPLGTIVQRACTHRHRPWLGTAFLLCVQ